MQIKMLEKSEKKTKNKINEKEDYNSNIHTLIEIKKTKREEENFQRTTLLHQLEKMKDDIFNIKKEINSLEISNGRLHQHFDKERIRENMIRDKVNQLNSRLSSMKNKTVTDKLENNMILNYYNNVIDQKWSFIHSSDERKDKQIKIAKEAKNDSLDKQEVVKRKVLSLCMLYNKYLRKKMEKELIENKNTEENFQTIKDITVKIYIKIIKREVPI